MADPENDPIQKRDFIYDNDRSSEELKSLGDRFFDRNYYVDALEAYQEGDVESGGEKIRDVAIEQGNFFLLRQINSQWSNLLDQETWQKAGQHAMENGRYTDAVKLFYAADEKEKMKEAEEHIVEETDKPVPSVVRKDSADAKEKKSSS